MLVVHHEDLLDLLQQTYDARTVDKIQDKLAHTGSLEFPCLDTGLFTAATLNDDTAYTGYSAVWVRDNVHIASAHLATGKEDVAAHTGRALLTHFHKQVPRIQNIIARPLDAKVPMNRPHIRFDGVQLADINQKWPHDQNDAIGYFLWLVSRLLQSGLLEASSDDWECLALFPQYLEAIRYWMDEDSGHWEESRKISASSIGVVVAGLRELAQVAKKHGISSNRISLDQVEHLLDRGRKALDEILPAECIQPESSKARRYDAALLFLVHPLDVVSEPMADRIIQEVIGQLSGDHGIRRYPGDSYWCADYKLKLAPEKRTDDFSDNLSSRDALSVKYLEAQWCLFDPVLSSIFGKRYRRTGEVKDRKEQVHHLNRALGQLTGRDGAFPELRCPESYYFESGRWIPSDATPLLWTQAMLLEALDVMRTTS
jgi:hypothetical protein